MTITSPIFNFGRNDKSKNNIFSDFALEKYEKFTNSLKNFNLNDFWNGTGEKKAIVNRYSQDDLRDFVDELNSIAVAEEKLNFAKKRFKETSEYEVSEKYIKKQGDQLTTVEGLSKAFDEAAKSSEKFNKSIKSIGLKGILGKGLKLGASFAGNLIATFAGEALFAAGAQALYNWVHAAEIAIEKGQEARNTISEVYSAMNERKTSINQLATEATGETYETSTESVEALAKKYAELAKGVNSRTNENVSLSTDDYELYLSISNQLAGVLPGLVSGLDSIFDNPIHRTA